MIKKISELLFDQKIIKQKQLAYLVRTHISVLPTTPPQYFDIDLSFIAKHSLRITRTPSDLDRAVTDAFYLNQYNVGSFFVSGIIFLDQLINHDKFDYQKFRFSIGLPIKQELVNSQISSDSELIDKMEMQEINEPLRSTAINQDITSISTLQQQLSSIITPQTNIFGEYHIVQLQKALNILRLKDCSIRHFIDIVNNSQVDNDKEIDIKLQTLHLTDLSYECKQNDQSEIQGLLFKTQQLIYHNIGAKQFHQQHIDIMDIINILIKLRQILEDGTDFWPGQKSILQLVESFKFNQADQDMIYYINFTIRNIFPTILPVENNLTSIQQFLQLLSQNELKVSKFACIEFLNIVPPLSLTKENQIRNEFYQLLDIAKLRFPQHNKVKLQQILHSLFGEEQIQYPLTYFYLFSEFYKRNSSQIKQMRAIDLNTKPRIIENVKTANLGRYELQFDRLLFFCNDFYNNQFLKKNKHLTSVTEFIKLVDIEFSGVNGKIALENNGVLMKDVYKRAENIYNNEVRVRGHNQPLITSMISKIFLDFTFVGSQRASNLILQMQQIFQSNKGMYQNFISAMQKWFFIEQNKFPLFFIYALFLELRQRKMIIKTIISLQKQMNCYNNVLQMQQEDDTIILKNMDELVNFYKNAKARFMQLQGGVRYTLIMNKQLLLDEVNEFFDQSVLTWQEFIRKKCNKDV